MTTHTLDSNIPLKVVVAKPGLDGHDRGAKIVARALRDSGMEVVYTGIYQSPESIMRAVIQEDADVLGVSSLSGAHLEYGIELGRLLRENDREDVLFIMGGTIPEEDAAELAGHGVHQVFGPGTPTGELVEYVKEHARNVPAASAQ